MQQVNYTLWTKHHGTPQSQSCLRFLIFKYTRVNFVLLNNLVKFFTFDEISLNNSSLLLLNLSHLIKKCASSSISLAEQFLHNLSFLGMFLYYDMLKDGKLVTYLFLKTNFGYEKYFTIINNFSYRKLICRFRVSVHRLITIQ
jgi:hypothetical protein